MPKNDIKTNADALTLLAERMKAGAGKPNLWGYHPHSKQQIFHSAEEKIRLYIGGNRSGKTTGGVVEDLWWATGRHPHRKVPTPCKGRVIGVDFINGIEKILRPEFARWCPLSDLRGGSWATAYSRELRTLYFENGSFIEFMSYDQDLDKFAGTSRDFIHFDEEPPQDIYSENRARLVDVGGSLWITMTPVEGMTWVYDDLYMKGKSPDTGIKVIEVDMTDNPHLNTAEVEVYIGELTEEERNARVHGQFVQLGGLIYKEFSVEAHVLDPVVPPRDWLWVASLDHGFNNPTAWLWHAVSPDGRVITFHEHYESGHTVDYHAARVHEINKSLGRVPDYYIGDPSIRNTDPITGTSISEEYIKYGVPITLANNDVAAGINRVARYLKVRSDGVPNLRITKNCVNLIWELQRYRWKTFANKRLNFQNNKHEQAHKKDDHACDSLRYFIMSRPDLSTGLDVLVEPQANNPLGLVSSSNGTATVRSDGGIQEHAPESTQWVIDEMMGAEW